jgi:WD40 repeat protein
MSAALSIGLLALAVTPLPPITALAIAPGGEQAVVGSQSGIGVVSLPDLKPERTLATQIEHVHALAFSPAGEVLAASGGSPGERGAVELWSWPAGALQATFPAGDDVAYDVAWSGDAAQLGLACADKTVRLQPTGGGKPAVLRPHSAAVLAVVWLPESDFVLSAGVDQSIRVLAPGSGETVRSLDNHTAAVRDLALSPAQHDGPPMIASAGADRTVRFWQPTIGRLVRFARLPSAPTAICWTPDASHVLAACEDGRLRAIDAESLTVVEFARRIEGFAHAVAATPDGSAAILAGERGQLRIVSLEPITEPVGNALRGIP